MRECFTVADSGGDPEQESAAAVARIDPYAGKMLQAVWFAAERKLLLVIHHLAVDGVSWRILTSDMAAAWKAISGGQRAVLDHVPVSFRTWARYLAEQANTPAIAQDFTVWESIVSGGSPALPGAVLDSQQDTFSTVEHLRITLPASLTTSLLTTTTAAFHAHINDVLLAALALAVCAWRGTADRSVLIEMEGHGRESEHSGFDLSRTVGWFTTAFPVSLDLDDIDITRALRGSVETSKAVKRIKEQLRKIPRRGLSYGLLRYLNPNTGENLAAMSRPQLGFNYLGRFAAGNAGDWSAADEHAFGGGADPEMPLPHLLDVNAIAVERAGGPTLIANWSWASRHLDESEVRRLAGLWRKALEAIAFQAEQGAGGHTPSDFPLVDLTQERVESLEARYPGLQEILPLAPLQQGLLFHAVYEENGPDAYTVQVCLELEGALDAERLRTSAQKLLQRHANLRAAIVHESLESPVQVITAEVQLRWQEFDLSFLKPGTRLAEQEKVLAEDRRQRFEFAVGPLLRFSLLRLEQNRALLVVTFHHLLLDGWSVPLLVGELFELYRSGEDHKVRARSYSDYLAWLAAQDRSAALATWKSYLAGIEEATLLAPHSKDFQLARTHDYFKRDLSTNFTARLKQVARERGLTLSSIMQGIWAVLLARLTGRNDVLFGVTVSGRPAELPGIENMVGLFINTIPVRASLRTGESMAALLTRMQESHARMMSVQYVGLTDIQREVGINNLFDTITVFENYPLDRAAFAEPAHDLRLAHAEMRDSTHYPLALVVSPDEGLHLRFDYDPEQFSHATIEVLAARFVRLLEQAAEQPEAALHRYEILEAGERSMLLEEFNSTAHNVSATTALEMIEAQAARVPHALAVIEGEQSLSYAELNEQSNRLAYHLIGLGIGPESVVGLALERSIHMIVAVLATFKAGAAYLPLDPDYPEARLAYMLGDAAPAVVLSSSSTYPRFAHFKNVLVLDSEEIVKTLHQEPAGNPTDRERLSPLLASHAAYVIYTSGSTGKPKGVVVSHAGIPSLAATLIERLELGEDSRMLQFASFNFDASVWEIMAALTSGATLVLPREARSGEELRNVIVGQKVTHALLPLSILASLAECGDLPVKFLINAGEALPAEVGARWAPGRRMINAYGPTEATVCATSSSALVGGEAPHIGSPVLNTRVYVLDADLTLVPAGVIGELYIAGSSLARGYLNRPGLTAERFTADPFGTPGTRMYRTGDLARWRADGNLDFIGRADEQVKVHGVRIELGEIESVLQSHPQVTEARVIAREDGREGKQLVAYVVAANNSISEAAELRRFLQQRLPDSMIPVAFVTLQALPLTPSGKLDRRALPNPGHLRNYQPPRNSEEEILCAMFAEILSLEQVSIDDNFFALGGHSLLAMRMVARLRSSFGVEISLREFYAAGSVKELSTLLQALLFTSNGQTMGPQVADEFFEEEEI